ncbi:MAG: SUMF1/EgtB/PvdO family nonheme iron enzyme [Chloroflexota bacterium]
MSYKTDSHTTTDFLNFSDFRPALRSIIERADTPLTVGVFGPWGSGKTSLLRMLCQDLDEMQKANIRTVWFTAWKYDRQDALWRAFILRVLDALYPPIGSSLEIDEYGAEEHGYTVEPQLLTKLDRLQESVYRSVEWQEMGKWAINWLQLAQNSKEAALELIPLSGGLKRLLKIATGRDVTKSHKSEAMAGIGREIKHHHREQLTSMEQFESTFGEVLSEILGYDGRLVVFVDDLDRCLPEKAIEVLEAIKLFLDVPGTVFVLGMDRDVVQRGVETRYGALMQHDPTDEREFPISGDTYLQKIIQIPFHLPPLAVEDMDDFLEKLEGDADDALDSMTRRVFARGLFANPRQAKRCLNIFRLLRAIAQERQWRPAAQGGLPSGTIAQPLLAKTVVIQTQYPELYQLWRRYPTIVQTLEAEYARLPTDEEAILHGIAHRDLAPSFAPSPQAEMARESVTLEDKPPKGEAVAGDTLGDEALKIVAPEDVLSGLGASGLGASELVAPETEHHAPNEGQATRQENPSLPRLTTSSGILAPFLENRQRYGLLEQMLTYPPKEERVNEGNGRTHFAGLNREQMRSYLRLAGTASAEDSVDLPDIPDDMIGQLLSGDLTLIQEGVSQLKSRVPDEYSPLRQSVQQRLMTELVNQNQAMTVRAGAGLALGQLGDPRTGVGIKNGLPDIGWCFVDAGPFTMGSDKKRDEYTRANELPQFTCIMIGNPYHISQYPITVAQYGAFIDAGGYEERSLWTDSGWEWKQANRITGPETYGDRFETPNHPQVGVSWYEATAFCHWLSEQSGTPIRLPTEAEWERASRSDDGRLYPWGNQFGTDRCNMADTGLGKTTSVGAFPHGLAACGAADMSGNVWEWCRTSKVEQYTYYAEEIDDTLEGTMNRVIRGGSFLDVAFNMRCAVRSGNDPRDRVGFIGFRVISQGI